jgi:hypothetical protein
MSILSRKPREVGRLRTTYSPPEEVHAKTAIELLRDIPDNIPEWTDVIQSPQPREIDLLEELAVILRRLTWSQMTEFGNGISADPKNIHEWSSK